jgi:7-carboxy-7-deazaguanine synthase
MKNAVIGLEARPFSKILNQPLVDAGLMLPLMEHFYTIQGEGAYRGAAAYFLRLGGCDVGCVWCDVKDSWNVLAHPLVEVANMVAEVKKHPGKIAVITGGEPSSFELGPLTEALQAANIRTHIETAGVYPLSGSWDWVCFSPKKFKKPLEEIYQKANELKVVIYNKSDFAWAEQHAKAVHENCRLFLQPEWGKAKEMMPLIVDYVKQHPKWEVSLQIHKYMDIP